MPMPKKANGADFEVSGGELTLRFDAEASRSYTWPASGARRRPG